MYTSAILVGSLAPFLALAAPQFGGPSDGPSKVGATSNTAAGPSSTTTAIALGTRASGVAPISASSGLYPTSLPSSSTTTASSDAVAPADTSLANDLSLIGQLFMAAKAPDRIKLIPNNASFKFDFNSPPGQSTTTGKGGRTVRADRQNFPPLIGTGMSMTLGFLGPCGFNTPHTHPRSAELNLVVRGTLETQFTSENGARTIHNTLGINQMTAFPQGALHTEFNPNCEDAIFVAGFASEDPGVQQTTQTLFGFDQDVVKAAIGSDFTFEGKDVEQFRSLIPANVAEGVKRCLAKCQIQRA
ncbi:MAG: hypothetical protein Q9197_000569 [Variospora fuerteventurae]